MKVKVGKEGRRKEEKNGKGGEMATKCRERKREEGDKRE